MYHGEYPVQASVRSFLYNVYGLMSAALVVTAGTAYYVSQTPAIYSALLSHTWGLILIFVAQIALVIALQSLLQRISFATALLLFMLFAISIGLTTSVIFLIYTDASIFKTFLITAGMFGIMSAYGYLTRSDLTTAGNIAFMALIGLVIAGIVNIFLKSSQFDLVISAVGVLVFTVLTAYDTQKLKELAQHLFADRETVAKVSVIGALTLYLDFINLFLFLLRFMGKKRD
jgi:FtsH-binding integral membrane protein